MTQVHTLSQEEGSHAIDVDQPVGQWVFGDLLAASHPTRRIEQPGDSQLRNRINEARPADPLWRNVAADHLQLHVVGQCHALDGAVGGPHATADLAALERGSGGSRRAKHALRRAEHDLAVGADVDEDAQFVLTREAGGNHAGDDVGAHVRPDERKSLDIATRVDVEPRLTGRDIERLLKGRRERHHRNRRGVDPEQKVEHRRVPDDHHLVNPVASNAGRLVQLREDRVHGALNRVAQFRFRLLALHPVADPRDDVGAERRLAVEGRAHRLGHAGAQVHQGADHRGRAEIKGNAVALLARIPGLDGNQMIATEHGGHLELGAPKESR